MDDFPVSLEMSCMVGKCRHGSEPKIRKWKRQSGRGDRKMIIRNVDDQG